MLVKDVLSILQGLNSLHICTNGLQCCVIKHGIEEVLFTATGSNVPVGAITNSISTIAIKHRALNYKFLFVNEDGDEPVQMNETFLKALLGIVKKDIEPDTGQRAGRIFKTRQWALKHLESSRGTATFVLDSLPVEIELITYQDFMTISKLIDEAATKASISTAKSIKSKIDDVLATTDGLH